MKKFLKNQQEYIAVIIFLLVVFLLTYFVLIPILGRIDRTKNEMEQAVIKQEIERQRLGELPKIREQYAEINSQQKKIDVLLDEEQAVTLIERLESLARDTNNEILISIQEDDLQQKNVPVSKVKKESTDTILLDSLPNKNYLKLKILLRGDYGGIFSFLKKLETLEYYSDIIAINIGQASLEQASFGQNTLGSFDVSNPFVNQTKGSGDSLKKESGKLSASLETVFYSRK